MKLLKGLNKIWVWKNIWSVIFCWTKILDFPRFCLNLRMSSNDKCGLLIVIQTQHHFLYYRDNEVENHNNQKIASLFITLWLSNRHLFKNPQWCASEVDLWRWSCVPRDVVETILRRSANDPKIGLGDFTVELKASQWSHSEGMQ